MLYEDESVSRLTEATTLWDSIANSRWFKRTAIILFLNKVRQYQKNVYNRHSLIPRPID